MKAIYKVSCDFYCMGTLFGMFIADTENMQKLKNESVLSWRKASTAVSHQSIATGMW